ncbi:patatin-like phospholipase family protein [Fusibacter ferrireducens]|uniref:Patatin-like phospholipase family protein n=1 Tax=Fusibacter ferrireducens TaxID=2785058 RepID=A0ABR9ZVP1_9FIRM|nr:patatin-like phospholipase family protein [Fusibacter ferrireducens]MBF4694524.1 patatin-like phospholipase family protein [Fusibacter ferrireducens]
MTGLVLEGGGAKGAFHVGAVKALTELGIEYDAVVGASIGSINGALIAMGDLKKLESVWLDMSIEDVIKGDEKLLEKVTKLEFGSDFDVNQVGKFLMETLKQGGLDVTPFKKRLKEIVDEPKLRASKIEYGLVTLSLSDLKPIEIFIDDIPEGKLHDYIMASANFPAFKIDKIDDKLLVDGGIFDNLPINMLIEKGYDDIIAIRVMGLGRQRRIKKKKDVHITMIKPSEDLGKTLEISSEKAAYNIKMGYYDTYRVFKALKGKTYYIKGEIDEELVFNELIGLSDHTLLEVGKLLGINKPPKRLLFEDVIPLIKDLLSVSDNATYGEIALALYEFLAKELKIDRFRIISFEQLVGLVHKRYREDKIDLSSGRSDLTQKLIGILSVKTNALFPQKLKDETLKHLFFILFETGFLVDGETAL